MAKLLSIKQKDLVSGLSPYKNDSRFGLLYSANGYNPALFGGGIAFTKAPIDVTGEVVVDTIAGMTTANSTIYALGTGGHFYKVATPAVTPTVTDLKSATQLTAPAQAIFTFKTKVGNVDYVYYLHNSTRIGQLTPSSDSFNDTFLSLTASTFSTRTPFYIAEDRVYFGTINTIGMIYDDLTNANPAKAEEQLDLPKGEFIEALSSDDTYLIIGATLSNQIGTKIYFWDYKNNYASWVKPPYYIPDTIYSIRTVNGISYATGAKGLWAFSFTAYPTLLREDVVALTGYTNQLAILKDMILLNGGSGILGSYGKINNLFQTSLLQLSSGYSGSVSSTNFNAVSTRGYVGTTNNKLYYVDYTTQKTASSDSIITSYIDLGGKYSVSQVDIIFTDDLASGDSVAIVARGSAGATEGKDYVNGTTISFTNDGAVKDAKSILATELQTDSLSLELTISGTCVIKRIDIYGEPINR